MKSHILVTSSTSCDRGKLNAQAKLAAAWNLSTVVHHFLWNWPILNPFFVFLTTVPEFPIFFKWKLLKLPFSFSFCHRRVIALWEKEYTFDLRRAVSVLLDNLLGTRDSAKCVRKCIGNLAFALQHCTSKRPRFSRISNTQPVWFANPDSVLRETCFTSLFALWGNPS